MPLSGVLRAPSGNHQTHPRCRPRPRPRDQTPTDNSRSHARRERRSSPAARAGRYTDRSSIDRRRHRSWDRRVSPSDHRQLVVRALAPARLYRRSCVGAVECNEAAIFPLPIESRAKDQDQKIAAQSASKRPRHRFGSPFKPVATHETHAPRNTTARHCGR